jgi:hypothetical protein
MPRPMWIGLAIVLLVILGVGLRIGVPIYQKRITI